MQASDLPSLSVRRPVFTAVLSLLIVIAGLAALTAVEVRELPDVDKPRVQVRAFWDGAAPETMDAEVTAVLEAAVARVAGVEAIESASEENNMRLKAFFLPSVEIDTAANDVREAVASVQRDLPDGVEEVTVVKASDDDDPIIRLALLSDNLNIEDLTRIAEKDVAPELSSIPGVAAVPLFGNQRQVLRVVVDPLRLASFGLSVNDVAETLETTDLDVPAGSFRSVDQHLIVRADASVLKPDDVERIEIAPDVILSDVAQAAFGPEEAESYVRLNGQRVVGVNIIRRAQSNTVEISDAVGRVQERLNQRLRGVEIIKMSDNARFIEGAVREVVTSLLLAVAIVIAVIYVFLGRFRVTLIPAIAIPISIIGTLAAIWLLGFSVNILTLLALVLATGLIVDDAIVVLENIQRQQNLGLKTLASAVVGTRQVFFAVLATTATLVAVFLPIAFLPGEAGRLFTEFGFVLAIAVAISSVVALTLGPMLASRLCPVGDCVTMRRDPMALLGRWLAERYALLLAFTLRARLLVIGTALILAGSASFFYHVIPQELLPDEDRALIVIAMQGPDGVGLDYMDRQADQVETILEPYRQAGEIKSVMSIVGRWDLNRVFVIAPLADWSARDRRQQDLVRELSAPLREVAGATVRIRRVNSLSIRGGGARFEVAVTGPDHQQIVGAALPFIEEIRANVPGLQRVRLDFQPTQPQLSVTVDRRRVEDLGVDLNDVEATLRAMVDGIEVAELNLGDRSIPVLLESAAGAVNDPGDLDNLFVPSTTGEQLPLSAFISIKEEGVAAELDRVGQKRAIEIDADLDPNYSLGAVVKQLQALGNETLPSENGLLFLGEAARLDESGNQVAVTFAIAVLVVFLVLAAQFESLLSSAVIVLTVPFGVAAAIYALLLSGTSLNIYSQIGLVMLVGLMAKNGILVVEFADQLRDRGMSVMEAITESACVRLRPVMMTMLSTVLSALPLIFGSGAGAEARHAIGWVVFGGLGISTLFTLILIPVFYSLLAPLAPPRAHAGVRLDRELRAAADADLSQSNSGPPLIRSAAE